MHEIYKIRCLKEREKGKKIDRYREYLMGERDEYRETESERIKEIL